MAEIYDEQVNQENNIVKEREESIQNKEKEDIQQSNDSQRSSTSCSSTNDYGNYQGIKSKFTGKNEDSDMEDNQSHRKHSAPLETKEFFLNFGKLEGQTRGAYINKLLLKGVLNLNQKEQIIKTNTIFIFDWDDTLFFTTHINPSENNTFFYESQSEKKFMNRIEFYVSEILNKALSKGEVFIITNSGDGWVHACAQFYYPNLIPILEKINIISARDLYQKEYPNDPTTWKIKAFNDLKKRFNFEKCIVSNIICIGDNNCEIIAAQKLGEEFKNCLVKTIKFREKPNLKELIKQIILINEQILRVYNYPKSLTIQVNKMKNPKK